MKTLWTVLITLAVIGAIGAIWYVNRKPCPCAGGLPDTTNTSPPTAAAVINVQPLGGVVDSIRSVGAPVLRRFPVMGGL